MKNRRKKVSTKLALPKKNPVGTKKAQKREESLVLQDPLYAYLEKVRAYPHLSREDELEIAMEYKKSGDKDAAARLITANLALVIKIAFGFRSQFQNMLDLIQEGNYGLLKAVQRFDPFKKVRFSTYATYWIRAYMIKYLLDNWRLVKVGTTNMRRKLIYNLKDVEQKLLEGGIVTHPKMLAGYFGATEKDVVDVQASLGKSDKSVDAKLDDNSSTSYADILPGSSGDYITDIIDDETKQRLESLIEKFKVNLKKSDLDILDNRILSENRLTLQKIGDRHNITREAVRQAEERLMTKLKTFIKDNFDL
ncbi:MAG: sigma-70 family RNA polymerase sigma factor [Nitrospinota bacterium]